MNEKTKWKCTFKTADGLVAQECREFDKAPWITIARFVNNAAFPTPAMCQAPIDLSSVRTYQLETFSYETFEAVYQELI